MDNKINKKGLCLHSAVDYISLIDKLLGYAKTIFAECKDTLSNTRKLKITVILLNVYAWAILTLSFVSYSKSVLH